MNDRQPYERHLAEKLQNLPPPGEVDQSWEQMRILLDKEMPRGGALPGRRYWWLLGIAIGVVFLATWLAGGAYLDRKKANSVAHTITDSGNNKVALPGDLLSTHDQPIHKEPDKPATDPVMAGTDKKQEPAAISDSFAPAGQGAAQNASHPTVSNNKDGIEIRAPEPENNISKQLANNRNPHADEAIITRKPQHTGKNNNAVPLGSSREKKAPANSRRKHKNAGSEKDRAFETGQADHQAGSPSKAVSRIQPTAVQSPLPYSTKAGPVLTTATTIKKDYATKYGLLLEPAAKSAARKKVQRKQEAGVLALGFTLPLAFPLGDQRAMGYNLWAGHNTVSDYLPSPHAQYHLNGKTFLQTEAQLISPQFIRSTLLYQNTSPRGPGGYYTTNSIYAKKLYYFNIPVSIHHSPFPGFYMGTGIQFSSMISGVALSEERKWYPSGGSTLLRETYSRFRNDSLSQKINGNEFRVLLDANYYFNRFTVGLRYNQALSNYISFRLSPGIPYSFEKNRALQFYLRYNLWEEKKRANANKTMLTLK